MSKISCILKNEYEIEYDLKIRKDILNLKNIMPKVIYLSVGMCISLFEK